MITEELRLLSEIHRQLCLLNAQTAAAATFPGPFVDDAEAAAAGVGIDKPYILAEINAYDMRSVEGRLIVRRIA